MKTCVLVTIQYFQYPTHEVIQHPWKKQEGASADNSNDGRCITKYNEKQSKYNMRTFFQYISCILISPKRKRTKYYFFIQDYLLPKLRKPEMLITEVTTSNIIKLARIITAILCFRCITNVF